MEIIFNSQTLATFVSLTALEIVLGIDNLVFLALIISNLPDKYKKKARFIGLSLAFGMRIVLLTTLTWIMGLNSALFAIAGYDITGRAILMLLGGGFLVYKAIDGIIEEITYTKHEKEIAHFKGSFAMAITQIVFVDFVFSFDSVLTAVGLSRDIPIMVAAVFVAILVMLFAAAPVGNFIEKYPSIKMLALAFIFLVGIILVAEGFHYEIPKGYLYACMGFSTLVEILNILAKKKRFKTGIKD